MAQSQPGRAAVSFRRKFAFRPSEPPPEADSDVACQTPLRRRNAGTRVLIERARRLLARCAQPHRMRKRADASAHTSASNGRE